jgi:hypothetical protein
MAIHKPIMLRTNGGVLVMSVPADITRQYDLKPGDLVYWNSDPNDPNTVKLKILKSAEIEAKISAL